MNKKIIFALPGNELLAESIASHISGEKGDFILRHFPDGETYIRILNEVENKEAVVICTLDRPDNKLLPLFFLCKLLKELKVKSICLVAPYLAYMRQDKQFNPGEAVTSVYFAQLLSSCIDRLITIDPHLHRRSSLKEIYPIPCEVLHASGLISDWIKINIPDAVLIGPDNESEQWVSEVAKNSNSPFVISKKIRKGDKEVEVIVPNMEQYREHTPVLIDDIISTAKTMIQAVKNLKERNMKNPVCIGVHGIFSGNAYKDLLNAGAKQVITCNTIIHNSNRINVNNLVSNTII